MIFFLFMLQVDVTPLMVACQSSDVCSEAALSLITNGARVDGLPNVCSLQSVNNLEEAVMVPIFLSIQIKEKPLICASARGNTKIVEYLLTFGADINQKDGVMCSYTT